MNSHKDTAAIDNSRSRASREASLFVPIAAASLLLAIMEVLLALRRPPPLMHASLWQYCALIASFVLIVIPLHLLSIAWGARFVSRSVRWPLLPGVLIAVAFGWSWHLTVIGGDGIQAHSYYLAIRLVLGVAFPAFCAAVFLFLGTERVTSRTKMIAGVVMLLAGLVCNLNVLLAYREFHGHLALFNAALLSYLCWVVIGGVRPRLGIRISMSLLVVVLLVLVGREPLGLQGNLLLRFSRIPAAVLTASPVSWTILEEPDRMIEPDQAIPSDRVSEFRRAIGANSSVESQAMGKSIILLGIDALRWDYWGEKRHAPEFHGLKMAGTYLPKCISQYPATPLAYGAAFCAQPPSVLLASPYWGEHRLFRRISDRFDHMVLTKPEHRFFDRGVVSRFLVDGDVPVLRHSSAEQAMEQLKDGILRAGAGESFFAWTHLLDTHAPYEFPGSSNAGSTIDRYKAAMRYVDEQVGRFLAWFREQEAAGETLIILFSDHGEALGEVLEGKEAWGHCLHVHNALSWVPAYLEGPGVPRNATRDDVTTCLMDIMPTVFDFLGVPIPPEHRVQGRSILRMLKKPIERAIPTEQINLIGGGHLDLIHDTMSLSYGEAVSRFDGLSKDPFLAWRFGLQVGRHKAIYDRFLRHCSVFDVESDPYELRDLSESNPALLRRMMGEVDRWLQLQSWVIGELEPLTR